MQVDHMEGPLDLATPEPSDVAQQFSVEEHKEPSSVSILYNTLSKNAKNLVIFDAAWKLEHPNTYDIGGTYSDVQYPDLVPDAWFFFSTTTCPGQTCLLNLFVCHRRTGNISIGVSNLDEKSHIKKTDKTGQTCLYKTLHWNTFKTAKPDETHYIKTFCYSAQDRKKINNTDKSALIIPIRIEMDTPTKLNHDMMKIIKLNHVFKDFQKKPEKSDLVLTTISRKQYKVHKIFLAANSPVLRDLIKSKAPEDMHAFIDISDDDMELLLEFLYTGTIKDILNKDCAKILQIADRFKLHNLFHLTQYALGNQITVQNAVNVACIAERYKLEELQTAAFTFIKYNPKVLETEGWKNLDDIHLAKKLLQFMHTKMD